MSEAMLAVLDFVRICLIAASFGAGVYAAFVAFDTMRGRVDAWLARRRAIDLVIMQSRELVRRS